MKLHLWLLFLMPLCILAACNMTYIEPSQAEGSSSLRELSLIVPRSQHTPTLLDDGRVLLAGGVEGPGSTETAEIFDPVTRQFKPVGSMHLPREDHTAVKMLDGSVLIIGGQGPVILETDQAPLEVFDPRTNQFELLKGVHFQGFSITATLLLDGRILLIEGGAPDAANTEADISIYDPKTNQISAFAKLNVPRRNHFAVRLNDGNVLVIGGQEKHPDKSKVKTGGPHYGDAAWSLELINVTDRSVTLFEPPKPVISKEVPLYAQLSRKALPDKDSGDVALLPDGRVYINANYGLIYDPESHEFFDTPRPNASSRERERITVLSDGRVLIAGGYYYGRIDGKEARIWRNVPIEIYDPKTNRFEILTRLKEHIGRPTLTTLQDGSVLLVGGATGDGYASKKAWLIRP